MLTFEETKELLGLYGYVQKSEHYFTKEFNNCQIVIKYMAGIYDIKVKSINSFPDKQKDSLHVQVQTYNPERINFSKLESNLLILFQSLVDVSEGIS